MLHIHLETVHRSVRLILLVSFQTSVSLLIFYWSGKQVCLLLLLRYYVRFSRWTYTFGQDGETDTLPSCIKQLKKLDKTFKTMSLNQASGI